ncbi:trans-Golgi network integral membrane protein 2 isoform X2 [Erinaceus europaeus]|uniref:Trans-Golgi network integral membrane protein 2 isoform X2 n=1 Tax=Erinaceus europaeus TaxID=9365 RepID=A0ABM3X3B2_ERIEU|nr:trans-Golgi network integral membrane protein 2 isoform X2 [Erinaceus europaeus]
MRFLVALVLLSVGAVAAAEDPTKSVEQSLGDRESQTAIINTPSESGNSRLVEKKPGPPTGQQPGPPTRQQPGPPTGQQPGPPTGQQPGPPTRQQPGPPTRQQPGPPTGQQPGPPTGQQPGPPTRQQPEPRAGLEQHSDAQPHSQEPALGTSSENAKPDSVRQDPAGADANSVEKNKLTTSAYPDPSDKDHKPSKAEADTSDKKQKSTNANPGTSDKERHSTAPPQEGGGKSAEPTQDEASREGEEDDRDPEEGSPVKEEKGMSGPTSHENRDDAPVDSKNKDSPYKDNFGTASAESSHFFAYLVTAAIVVAALYIAYHNKRKIIAFVLEGKKSKVTRRPKSNDYQRLDQKGHHWGLVPAL